MSNHPFIKVNYPHHEGIWAWGNVADQVVLLITNLRKSIVECKCIIDYIYYLPSTLPILQQLMHKLIFLTDHDIEWDLECKSFYLVLLIQSRSVYVSQLSRRRLLPYRPQRLVRIRSSQDATLHRATPRSGKCIISSDVLLPRRALYALTSALHRNCGTCSSRTFIRGEITRRWRKFIGMGKYTSSSSSVWTLPSLVKLIILSLCKIPRATSWYIDYWVRCLHSIIYYLRHVNYYDDLNQMLHRIS
jgi:hypothetical protein